MTHHYYKCMKSIHRQTIKELKKADNILAYLYKRGLTDDTIRDFGLGANDDHTRVVFPLFAADIGNFNEVAGFQTRSIDGSEPRYKNTENSEYFRKSYFLFGINAAGPYIRDSGVAYVVEGVFDAMMMYQRGFKNTVATMGAHLSHMQAHLLGLMCETVVLVFDGDAAGLKGMADSFAPLVSGMVKKQEAIILPGGYDPADYLYEYQTFANCDRKLLSEVWFKVRSDVIAWKENMSGMFALKHSMIKEIAKAYHGDGNEEEFIGLVRKVIDAI